MRIQLRPAFHHAFGEADANHRIFHAPIPLVVAIQLLEQRLIAREEFGERIEEEALAKAARAGDALPSLTMRKAKAVLST
jgi:hypothetical protein